MQDISSYIAQNLKTLYTLIEELCAIPAPSHHEQRRAEFCRSWLLEQGAKDVRIDEAQNVIYHLPAQSDEYVILMAHTDTVFPDMEPMPFECRDGRMYAPGVGDDTANLAVLLLMAKYVTEQRLTPRYNILFVANSCEEGLGNLKGSRQLMQDYGESVREVISLDGYFSGIANDAVGSVRYRVTVETEGGHSFGNFGNKNAIHYLAQMIARLYEVKVPTRATTTYNVGVIEGGTSVNTIAQNAAMLYEYRSEDEYCLDYMKKQFEGIITEFRAMGIEVSTEVLGHRPCSSGVDRAEQLALTKRVAEVIERHSGLSPSISASSTDCNIPLSMGIPAVCTGVCMGGGAHTRGEWIETASLETGFKIAADIILHYFS